MNEPHNPKLKSWVESANDPACDFPIQNLPFGIFRKKGSNEHPRGGVAIGFGNASGVVRPALQHRS